MWSVYFMAVHCFICGGKKVAVARYQMICLVLEHSSIDNKHLPFGVTLAITRYWILAICLPYSLGLCLCDVKFSENNE